MLFPLKRKKLAVNPRQAYLDLIDVRIRGFQIQGDAEIEHGLVRIIQLLVNLYGCQFTSQSCNHVGGATFHCPLSGNRTVD